jgi:hypothetical protein
LLDDTQIERYARQIVVPGIGAAGQEKLLHSTVLVLGHPRGCAAAALYLRAAGVTVVGSAERSVHVVVVCDRSALDAADLDSLTRLDQPVCSYSLETDGFTSGVYREATLPSGPALPSPFECMHDAAACEVAAMACAILLGLPHRDAVVRVGI